MREITDHKLPGLNEAIRITAVDVPGPGGANHRYNVIGEAEHIPNIGLRSFGVNLRFQKGPIAKPEDMNGITNEALVAVVIDRMRGFQYARHEDGSFNTAVPGKFASRENAMALTCFEDGLTYLQMRTKERIARGVEGKNVP